MQTIYLDISNKGVIPTIHAKQGDVGRKFQVVLTDSGLPYIPVGGSAFSIWYSGASGEGNYTEVGDKSAFSANGNKVTVEMIAQMLSNDGEGILSLVLNDPNGNQISTWNIHYICEYVPGAGSQEAKAYYTAFSQAVENLPYPDASLSVSGKAADAAATGKALAGKAPALESANYQGCYYRMVGGVQEWLNPPMVPGVEYRTTERYCGYPVYCKLVLCGTPSVGNTRIPTDIPSDRVIVSVEPRLFIPDAGLSAFKYLDNVIVSHFGNYYSDHCYRVAIDATSVEADMTVDVVIKYILK